MSKLKSYLSFQKKNIFLNLALFALLILMFWLFELPLKVISFLALMWSVILIVYGLLDFMSFSKRMTILKELVDENIPGTDFLPASPVEEEYVRILLDLYYKNRRLVETDEARYEDTVDYFTAWAHQIKTPIAAMSLITEDMENDDDRTRIRGELTDIEGYVDMVLNFLRLGSDSNDLLFEKIDVNDVVKEVVRKFSVRFIGRGIGMEYEPSSFLVTSDRKWLRFILSQILSNALKYSNKGSIKIFRQDNVLVVEDQGIGINEEDLPRIFEKGYTGYTGRKFEKSTGLGLYLCKKACDMIGVGIKIESKTGVGTKVFLTFAKEETDVRD